MRLHTLNNTLDNIKRDLKAKSKTALLHEYQTTELLSPPRNW
jgi:hypothetical protein